MERLQTLSNQLSSPASQQQNHFKYTVDGGCLTLEQRQFYEDNGQLIVEGLLGQKNIESWTDRFIEYCDGKHQPLKGMQVVRDISVAKGKVKAQGQAAITKIQDFQNDPVLYTFCTHPNVIPYLKSFCGPDIKSVHTMFINKPPHMGSTSRHPLHQDLAYFPFRPADRIVAAWSALETATRENGSLVIYPGTHKGQFLEHVYPDWEGGVNKAYFGIKSMPPPDAPKIFATMKAGDVVFFHPLIIHGSGENRSSGYRKSMCCHFANSHCHQIDIKGTYSELMADEIMSYWSKKQESSPNLKYEDIWRFKSKLVSGHADQNGI